MIIVNLKGGLGNQMFQYALGRVLSIKNKDVLKLDTSSLSNASEIGNVYRPFSLKNFNIKAEIATHEEIVSTKGKNNFLTIIVKIIINKYIHKYYISFNESILCKKGDVYLDGYFQSEKYFIDYRNEIINDLETKEGFKDKALEWLKKIESDNNSISIHIRRTDYLEHPDFGGICTENYFNNAIKIFKSKFQNPVFYIFSDDIGWVKDNINLPSNSLFVSNDKLQDFEELVLMSKCRNNIISNSSFSWWAAWLNKNNNKIIICPSNWVNINKSNFKDIIPSSWTKI